MSVSKKDLQLLGFAVGILAVIAVYFLVFSPYKEKTDALKSENADMTYKIAELEKLDAQKADFAEETSKLEQKIKEIYMKFPTMVQEEDVIAEGIDMEHSAGVVNHEITYDPFEIAYTPIAETIDEMPAPPSPIENTVTEDSDEAAESAEGTESGDTAEGEATAGSLTLIKQPVEYTFMCDVTTLVRAADFVAKQNNRDVITGVSVGYDSGTGLLIGQIDVDKYYIQGLSKEYEPSDFGYVPKGVYNIFSSLPQQSTPSETAPLSDEPEENSQKQ